MLCYFVLCYFVLSATDSMAEAESTDYRELIQKADELYKTRERQIYELLVAHRDSSNPDILWRLERSARKVARLADTSKEEKEKLTYEQLDISRKAVDLGPSNHSCHQVAVSFCANCN